MIKSNHDSSNLFHIVYISHETQPLTTKDIKNIESAAQQRNCKHDVSGLLLYNNARFMQFLEGPKDHIEMIFSLIKKDNRHHKIEVLIHEPIVKRQFTNWHMKLASVDDIDATGGPIYHKLFDVENDSIESIDIAMSSMNLLQDFKLIYSQSHV